MYRVKVRKQIHGCFAAISSLDAWLVWEIEIPFAPSKDIVYHPISEAFTEIYWMPKSQSFEAYVESDKTIYNAYRFPDEERIGIDDLVESWVDQGWSIESMPTPTGGGRARRRESGKGVDEHQRSTSEIAN